MIRNLRVLSVLLVSLLLLPVSPAFSADDIATLDEIAFSERQWTGAAVSKEGRMFVNYPRWSDRVPVSVAEITIYGTVNPIPNEIWNSWSPGKSPQDHLVAVQSVYIDADNDLWILDPANPQFKGVVAGGPKLLRYDLKAGQVVQRILFDDTIAPENSYLNDVRVDTERGVAYISDSGAGALIVVDLNTGYARRLLADHFSVKAENIVLTIDGEEWRRPDGSVPRVHVDGIALTEDGDYLYYQALTGRTLYRIATQWLRDPVLSAAELESKVELVVESGASDAIMFGPEGYLYLTSIEYNAVRRMTPDRQIEMVVQDPRLQWPDSFALGPDGRMVVTTSQIHLGDKVTEPYRIFRMEPKNEE